MDPTLLSVVAVVGALSAAVFALSTAAVAVRLWSREYTPAESAVLLDEKLRAYRELLDQMVAFNRAAVELDSEEFQFEMDNIALEQESQLDEAYRNVNQAFQSNFHVIDPSVRAAVGDYVDYPATYHGDGVAIGELLTRGGAVSESMREDLGLQSIFPRD